MRSPGFLTLILLRIGPHSAWALFSGQSLDAPRVCRFRQRACHRVDNGRLDKIRQRRCFRADAQSLSKPHLNSIAVEAEGRERTSSERLRLLAGLARREYRLDSE
jgi:hypothetical protein